MEELRSLLAEFQNRAMTLKIEWENTSPLDIRKHDLGVRAGEFSRWAETLSKAMPSLLKP
jgi:hypothetical protein